MKQKGAGMPNNNLNAVRFIAAVLVLYGHSFVFLGLPEPLFLSWSHLGPVAVYVFFTISGYLITQSWERDPHFLRFFIRRCLRIFPGLIVCVLFCIFVLGPIFTTIDLKTYFTHPATRSYFSNNSLLFVQYYLPGVFETVRVPNAVNGSLWSLPAEFFMYMLVAFVGMFLRSRWIVLALFVASALLSVMWAQKTPTMLVVYGTDLRQVVMCASYFWAGAVFYRFNLHSYFSLTNVVIAGFALLLLEPHPFYLSIATWLLLPWIVLAFGLSSSAGISRVFGKRDYSYGIYIYAFPVQQSVVYMFPNIGLLSYIALSFGVTLILAALSWHFIEEKMLRFKVSMPHQEPQNETRHSNAFDASLSWLKSHFILGVRKDS